MYLAGLRLLVDPLPQGDDANSDCGSRRSAEERAKVKVTMQEFLPGSFYGEAQQEHQAAQVQSVLPRRALLPPATHEMIDAFRCQG